MITGVPKPRRFWSLVWFQVLLVIALLVSAVSMSTALLRTKLADEIVFTYRVQLNQVNIDLLALQSSLRGYVATGEPVILYDYQQKMPAVEAALTTLLDKAPFPQATLDVLRAVQADFRDWRLRYAEREIAVVQGGDRAAASVLLEASTPLFDSLVERISSQRIGLRELSNANSTTIKRLSWVILGTVGLLSLLLFWGTLQMTQMWRRQRRLLLNLEQLTADLQDSNADLHASTRDLEQSNRRLTNRISEAHLLNDINMLLAPATQHDQPLDAVAARVGQLLQGWCSIWLLESYRDPHAASDVLLMQSMFHPETARLDRIRAWIVQQTVRASEGIHAPLFTDAAPSVMLLQVPEQIRNPQDLPAELQEIADLINLSAYLAVPLLQHGQPVGMISVALSDSERVFEADQELFLLQAAASVSSYLQRSQLLVLAERRAAELQVSFDSISDIVVVYDRNGTIQRINPAGEDFVLAGQLVLLRPSGQPLLVEEHPVLRVLAGEIVADYELAFGRADGSSVLHEVSVAPIMSHASEPGGAVLVARDITSRKELERLKDDFMANMSHELRTPLTAIMGYSELLLKRRNEVLTPWHVNKIDGIRTGGQRLLKLVNDLLDLARLDAGQIDLVMRDHALSAVIDAQLELLSPALEEKQLRLHPKLLARPSLLFDADRIGQVLMNLLANAIKFTPEAGQISIASDLVLIDQAGLHWGATPLTSALPSLPAGRYVAVAVSDSGVGMPAAALPHVWDRFYQVEGSASRRFGGTGLGLAIVRQLVELHHGAVWADSPGPDQGSTFGFVLPLISPLTPDALPHLANAPSILLVDDDPATLAIFGQHLHDAGYNVLLARTAADALRLAEEQHPDAITLDLILPDGDGWAMLAALRQIPTLTSTPVVIASIVDAARDYSTMGVSTYLVKPISGERLVQVIQQVVGPTPGGGDVLIVDDDPAMVELLQTSLGEQGFATRTARNGAEALDRLTHEPLPLLILLDLMMPVVDGFQLLARLREVPETRQVPVIILTARDLSGAEVQLLRDAAQGLYAKQSIDLEALLQLVQRHMPLRED